MTGRPLQSKVLLLNGVGSAGKSSIARSLQRICKSPYLHIQMDAFLDMMPEVHQAGPEGFMYSASLDEEGRPTVDISSGPLGVQVLRGMRHAVAAMAIQGNNLIVDDVARHDDIEDYAKLLTRFEFLKVGVMAPLEVLERRERERGDRQLGLARGQFGHLHDGIAYDLEVDTSEASPEACARVIQARFSL